jgi:hypothetical protein
MKGGFYENVVVMIRFNMGNDEYDVEPFNNILAPPIEFN